MNPLYLEISKEIKKKNFSPFYLLHGDENYYISLLANEIENNALPVSERSFNQNIYFGKDLTVGSLLNYARSFPMMGEKQVIIVKEAQAIQGFENKENTKLIEQYFQNPQATTLLVLCFNDTLDERKVWVKSAIAKGKVFKSKKFYDDKLYGWVEDFCQKQKLKISHKAILLLVESIGNDLTRMASEIEKIVINLKIDEEITDSTIERFVGLSKEYNFFEFQKAIIQRDVVKANNIAIYFSKNQKQNPLTVTVNNLYVFFSKVLMVNASKDKSEKYLAPMLGVNPYFVKDYLFAARNYPYAKNFEIISYINDAELFSKGIDSASQSEKNILQDLIFKILH